MLSPHWQQPHNRQHAGCEVQRPCRACDCSSCLSFLSSVSSLFCSCNPADEKNGRDSTQTNGSVKLVTSSCACCGGVNRCCCCCCCCCRYYYYYYYDFCCVASVACCRCGRGMQEEAAHLHTCQTLHTLTRLRAQGRSLFIGAQPKAAVTSAVSFDHTVEVIIAR